MKKKTWREVVKLKSYLQGGQRKKGKGEPSIIFFIASRVPVNVNVINVNKNLSLFEKKGVDSIVNQVLITYELTRTGLDSVPESWKVDPQPRSIITPDTPDSPR